MASLWSQLDEQLPKVLSSDAGKAVNGTKLLALVTPLLTGEYSENTLRQHFSDMSKDTSTVIAKVAQGHGYYLRAKDAEEEADAEIATPTEVETAHPADFGSRDDQPEEKFRSVVIRYAELENQQFPIHVEHTKSARRDAGVNKWKFPDLVLLRWEVGKLTEDGIYKLDQDMLAVRTSLGEPPFRLHSLELKVALSLSSFRENFFQCVSNSKWAHQAILAVASPINDQLLNDELKRLASSYGVLVVSYGLSEDALNALPAASAIRKLSDSEFEEQVSAKLRISFLSSVNERANLDWEHINDIRNLNTDFADLFEWTAYCLAQKRAYSFGDFSAIRLIQQKT